MSGSGEDIPKEFVEQVEFWVKFFGYCPICHFRGHGYETHPHFNDCPINQYFIYPEKYWAYKILKEMSENAARGNVPQESE